MYPDPIFLNVNLYGIMIAIGLLFAFGVLFFYSKMKNIDTSITDFILYDGVVSIIAGFGFAGLFQALYNYIEDPSVGFKFNGITFLGGFVGGAGIFLAIYFIFRKRLKGKLIDSLSVIPCAILIGHAFGRMGCFFAGCCYGKETSSALGVHFKYVDGKVIPTNLYEAIFLFILFGVCSFLYIKYNFKYNLPVYCIGYGTFRFIIEFFRGDDRGKLFKFLSPSQFWSILMVIAGIVLIFALKPLYIKREKELKEQVTSKSDTTENSVA